MKIIYLLLLIVAAICFAIAAFVRHRTGDTLGNAAARTNFVAAGLLAWVLVPLIQQIDSLE